MSLVALDDVEQSVQLSVATPLQPKKTPNGRSRTDMWGQHTPRVIGIAGCMHRLFLIPFPTSAASMRQQTELTQVIESLLRKVGRERP